MPPPLRLSRGTTPSLSTSRTIASSRRRSAMRMRVGAACLRALRTASETTDCASGCSVAGTATSSASSTTTPRCARSSSRTSRRGRDAVGVRPSGRWIASRSSSRAPWTSVRQRSRTAAGMSPAVDSASDTPNSRWMTPSWTSRARSMRSVSARARSLWRVAVRAATASAAVLPTVHSISSWLSSGSNSSVPRSARRIPYQKPPADMGVHRTVRSPSCSTYSGGRPGSPRWAWTTTTLSLCSACSATGAMPTCTVPNSSVSIPWLPTARTSCRASS
jgi:hypothetical protein